MTGLQELSNALADAVTTAGQSLVRVNARRLLPASGVVWSMDGLIVAAHHTIHAEAEIGIGLPDGQTIQAALVGRDPGTDLALLRAEASDLTPAVWVEANDLRVGYPVMALGRPGRSVQATLGIVSAVGGGWRTPAGGTIDPYLQTDVVMYPGFSGGPLIGVEGHVMGINSSALMRGVSLTIPLPTVRRVVEALLAFGRVRRGYLGIGSQPVRLPQALTEQLGQETGVLIVSVEPGSPADAGGLVLGDTIVTLDGERVEHMDNLLGLLSSERVGRTVPVQVVRGGQAQELSVTIGEQD